MYKFEKFGKGREYDKNFGELIFEGEYLKGERYGRGKEFYDNGLIQYEGEYCNGKKMEKEKNMINMDH